MQYLDPITDPVVLIQSRARQDSTSESQLSKWRLLFIQTRRSFLINLSPIQVQPPYQLDEKGIGRSNGEDSIAKANLEFSAKNY